MKFIRRKKKRTHVQNFPSDHPALIVKDVDGKPVFALTGQGEIVHAKR